MKKITTITEVDHSTQEGKLLAAAICKITTESQTDKTPDEVLAQLNTLSEDMFKDETKN